MSNIYETRRLVNEYLLFHYGSAEEVLPWKEGPASALGFAVRTVTELLDAGKVPSPARALDLGCAVGRSSFELAKHAAEVIGIDFSQAFIDAAANLAAQGTLPYERTDEADRSTQLVATRPGGVDPSRLQFEQGDAMDLRDDLGSFDIVHAANLLCRLPDPSKLIDRLPALVIPGGQLLLTTPCTWLEDFTPKDKWPKGSTRGWLRETLSGHFDLAEEKDLPFLIREHARKYQWSVALGSRWIRNG